METRVPHKRPNFPDVRHVEERYFRKKEQELIKRLKEKAKKEAARKGLLEAVGVSDEGILQTLEELGYNRDTVSVLHLFPLVVVAWADGAVSENERAKILEAARAWDVTEGKPAHARLREWLDERPDEIRTSRALRVIRDLMQFRSGEKQQDYRKSVLALCEQVAEASGGILGIYGKISREERAVIKRVANELAVSHKKAAEKVLAES
jgi:uncharacterized tellurite resistance protein B-like protein